MIIQTNKGNIDFNIDTSDADKRFKKAQVYLDNRVLTDSNAYAPKRAGVLRQSGIRSTRLGSGEVSWRTPYAHYLYIGKAMVGVVSKSAFARKGEPKEYNGKHLSYHQPGTVARWFETAKKRYLDSWLKGVKKIVGN